MTRYVFLILVSVAAVTTVIGWGASYWPRSPQVGILFNRGWWLDFRVGSDTRITCGGHVGRVWLEVSHVARYEGPLNLQPAWSPIAIRWQGIEYNRDALELSGSVLDSSVDEYLIQSIEWVVHRASVPFWFITVILGMYPGFAVVNGPLTRWRRRRRGLCQNCAYDLRGDVSGVCPECGTGVRRDRPPQTTSSSD